MGMDFHGMAQQCAPNVAPQTLAAVVSVESSHNPYAIGVVDSALPRQPRSLVEALAAVRELVRQGRNFSMGLAQVNRHNLPRYNVSYEQIFDPCTNLRVGGQILEDCYRRALPVYGDEQASLRASFSCYYSGNFTRGFRPDRRGEPSYVQKVVLASHRPSPAVMVPAIADETGASTRPVAQRRTPRWNDPLLLGQGSDAAQATRDPAVAPDAVAIVEAVAPAVAADPASVDRRVPVNPSAPASALVF